MTILEPLIFGATLGLSAGISPGPFLSLVAAQTLKYGFKEGARVAFSVLLTDVFFIVFSVLALSMLASNQTFLGLLSIVGGLYLLKLAYDSYQVKLSDFSIDKEIRPHSIRKGMMVLFLSPGSYLFWFTLAGPELIKTFQESWRLPIMFLLGIYVTFIGSNLVYALIFSKAKALLHTKVLIYLLKIVAVSLVIFAAFFLRSGVMMLI